MKHQQRKKALSLLADITEVITHFDEKIGASPEELHSYIRAQYEALGYVLPRRTERHTVC